ncbi:hypothetical protein AB0I35_30335, partial [Nocardia sp. NPDC050378]|uniref:hypothetical protein n=1 Tax=Nocardia sp. NPDC050378 TaxID=3155400 RepID=UPI0033C525D9
MPTGPNPKKEEKGIGADLALVVSIEMAGRLRLAFAEFVQVKKSYQEVGDCFGHQRCRFRCRDVPADDRAGVGVEHERHIRPPRP